MVNLEQQRIVLGAEIRRGREIVRMTYDDVGALVGRSRTIVNRYELGQVEPTALMLLRLIDVLGLDPAAIGRAVRDSSETESDDGMPVRRMQMSTAIVIARIERGVRMGDTFTAKELADDIGCGTVSDTRAALMVLTERGFVRHTRGSFRVIAGKRSNV